MKLTCQLFEVSVTDVTIIVIVQSVAKLRFIAILIHAHNVKNEDAWVLNTDRFRGNNFTCR